MDDGNPLMEEKQMRRLGKAAIAIPAWLCLCLVLAGADRGCFFVETDCAEMEEQACLDDPECQAVYVYPNTYDDELGCGGDGTRCIGGEPVFETCEAKPACETLGEEACLTEGACQAIYGFSDDDWALNGADGQPRCAPGTRCIMPPETFLECLDADADPCAGLEEQACWQRPMCEAEYVGDACLGCEAEYAGCNLREGECSTADDCYAVYKDGWPECANFHFTCEAGTCVEHCDDFGCKDDSECGADERCEIRCGNGWCEGQCVLSEFDCQVDADCSEGQFCQPINMDCLVGSCPGVCTDGVWVFNEPIQCGGNPWELDAQQNPERYYECMLDCGDTDCGWPTLEEICRVEVFFLTQGIWLHDVRDVHTYDEVCAACACPRGDTLYALVDPYDLDRIQEFGFMPF
jgi:hypothetical protein